MMQIRDSNKAILLAACAKLKCQTIDLGIARDDVQAVQKALDNAIVSEAHILITTGGVSMGDKDFVKPLLREQGTVLFEKVYSTWSRSLFTFIMCLQSEFSQDMHMEICGCVRRHVRSYNLLT